MQPLKYLKYLVMVARFNSNAVVPHKDLTVLLVQRQPADFHTLGGRTVELHGIADEILEDLPQQCRLSLNGGPFISRHEFDV